MANPFTALMYAVQVMNFLKALIERTLRGREDSTEDPEPAYDLGHFDENGRESPSKPRVEDDSKDNEETEQPLFAEEPIPLLSDDNDSSIIQVETCGHSDLLEQLFPGRDETGTLMQADSFLPQRETERFYSLDGIQGIEERSKVDQLSKLTFDESPQKMTEHHHQPSDELPTTMEKSRVISNLSLIESRIARIEAWR